MDKTILLYNTLTRKKETFTPFKEGEVGMYTCGPTVYNYTHIGNLRSYVFADLLRRTLRYNGFQVKQIMNITDIGHLSSDGDIGEDKMTKGLLREGKELNLKNMRELAEFYTESFKKDLGMLNIEMPSGMHFASDYVEEDIELVKKLENKKYAYRTSDGIYFDTAKMPDYGVLWGKTRSKEDLQSRITENPEKKNREDFALWKFSAEGGSASGGNKIGFPSPWGIGFPGWHIECSAMGMKFLGEQFDIHTGGIDLIPTHHTNEIAQSECATGKKPFVKFWLHSEFVDTGGTKMSKSENNFLRLESLGERNISPTTYRFWLLMANYRTKVNFVWEALMGAEIALKRLYGLYLGLGEEIGHVHKEYQNKFKEYLDNDLDTPRALSLLWDVFKDENISDGDKKATILDFDRVLGLGFEHLKKEIIPKEIQELVIRRAAARLHKDFKKSDELREKINSLGYKIEDSSPGEMESQKVSKI